MCVSRLCTCAIVSRAIRPRLCRCCLQLVQLGLDALKMPSLRPGPGGSTGPPGRRGTCQMRHHCDIRSGTQRPRDREDPQSLSQQVLSLPPGGAPQDGRRENPGARPTEDGPTTRKKARPYLDSLIRFSAPDCSKEARVRRLSVRCTVANNDERSPL
jgi:hypothetical protein